MKLSYIVKLVFIFLFAILGTKLWGGVNSLLGVDSKFLGCFLASTVMVLLDHLYDAVVKVIFSKEYREKLNELYSSSRDLTKKEFDELKRKTVVELYLINEKKAFIKAKIYTLLALIIFTIIHIQYPIGVFCIGVCIALFFMLEIKTRVTTYRVIHGFFGSNRYEAIQLIKFINDNIDEINDGTDGGRKILNNKNEPHANLTEIKKGVWGRVHG